MFAVLGISLVLVAGVAASERTGAVGTNVNVSKQSGYNGEGTIAIDRADPTKLFAGFNNLSDVGQWMHSTDSGATWTASTGIASSCCDNAAAADSYGNIFLTNINGDLNAIPLYLSTNGGAAFRLKATIDTGSIDQPTVKAGPGSVWVTWNADGTLQARGAAVTGLGTVGSFSAKQSVSGSTGRIGKPQPRRPSIDLRQSVPGSGSFFGQFGDIAVGPDGQVVVVYQSDTAIYANTDANGLGAGGFGPQVLVSGTNVDKFDEITPQPNRTIDAEANLAYDLSSGPHAGRLYLTYTDEPKDESNNTDIFLRYSDDDGATWSPAQKLNDDRTKRAQFFPYPAVDPVTGNLIVTWHDARNDSKNTRVQYWGAISRDGAATFEPNFQISTGASAAADDGDPNEFGDYSWVDLFNDRAYPIWGDTSNTTGDNPDGTHAFDMYTAKIRLDTCFGEVPTITGTNPAGETLNGTPGDDVIVGLGGNDVIDGKGGNDKICAGGGNDTIIGGAGNDQLDGGAGNDTFDEGPALNGSDVIVGGADNDTTTYSGRAVKLNVTLDGKANDGEKKENDNVQTENVTGGSSDDKLTGDDVRNVLTGGAGKDSLGGGGSNDSLISMDGVSANDQIDCGKNDGIADDLTIDAGDKLKNCP